jgi:hypothetical protein
MKKKNKIDELAAINEANNLHINKIETLAVEKNIAIGNLEAELVMIRHSLAWRLVEGFRRRVNQIFPESSRSRKIYLKCIAATKIYLNKGFFAVLKKAMSKYRMGINRQDLTHTHLNQQTDDTQSFPPRRENADKFCPIPSKRIVAKDLVNDSDLQAVKEKIQFIKQELLDEFHQM